MKEIIIISPNRTFVEKFAQKFDIQREQISENLIQYVQKMNEISFTPKYIFITLHSNSKSLYKYIENIQSKFSESGIFILLDKEVNEIKLATLFDESNISILPFSNNLEIYSACLFLRENNYCIFPTKALKKKIQGSKIAQLYDKNIKFSKNENDVLINLTRGFSYQEISDITAMKIDTVRYYIKKIYKKLEVKNRHQCIQKYSKIIKTIK